MAETERKAPPKVRPAPPKVTPRDDMQLSARSCGRSGPSAPHLDNDGDDYNPSRRW